MYNGKYGLVEVYMICHLLAAETLFVIGDKLDDYLRDPNEIYHGKYGNLFADQKLIHR